MRLVALVFCLVCLLSLDSSAQHGDWQDKYSNGESRCCGMRDCQVVRARLLTPMTTDLRLMTVEVEGVVMIVSSRKVHISEDDHAWYCAQGSSTTINVANLRCLFLAIGG